MLQGRITEPPEGQEDDYYWVRDRLQERYIVKNYGVAGLWGGGFMQLPCQVADFWLYVDPILQSVQEMQRER